MEGNKRNFFKKRPNPQFKRKGGIKKGKWQSSRHELSSGGFLAGDTVYRILCPSKKIGSVIGKGGDIVKSLREETQAKITVADSVHGSDERVIIVYSSSTKNPRKVAANRDSGSENEGGVMEPHCAAQDALLKVHDRIIEEDLFGGMASEDENENAVVIARLLVPNNMVGCLLGRRGDVIQKLRSETGASIRVLPADHLPACAMSTDELVQISGKSDIAKKALYKVSTLLHQNPRKDEPPSNFLMHYRGPDFHPGAPMTNIPPPGNPVWSHRNSPSRGMPPMPWIDGYGSQPHGFGPAGFDGVPPEHSGEASGEFSMKILCSTEKIGGVIGKGGLNVKQLQQETGASIHVEDALAESEERVIRVSSVEALWNPSSQTIEAILRLQNKTSEFSEKGIITTRLLVPSSKVGCILGQGGHIINEMRKRTHADIRVYSKDDKPKFASEDEELVQVSGNFDVARDALTEISSRLRTRCLRDANPGDMPAPVGPIKRFGPQGSVPGGPVRAGYEPFKGGGHDYERQSYPLPSTATGYPNFNRSMETKFTNKPSGSLLGAGVGNFPNVGEVAGTRVKLQDPQASGSESMVDVREPPEHFNSRRTLQPFMSSSGQNINPQQSAYPFASSQQGAYPSINPQQCANLSINSQCGAYENISTSPQGAYPGAYHQHGAHPSINSQHGAYENIGTPPQGVYPGSYHQQGGYPQSGGYHNLSTHQGSYQY